MSDADPYDKVLFAQHRLTVEQLGDKLTFVTADLATLDRAAVLELVTRLDLWLNPAPDQKPTPPGGG